MKTFSVKTDVPLVTSLLAYEYQKKEPVIFIAQDNESFFDEIKNLKFFLGSNFSYLPSDEHSPYAKSGYDPLCSMEKSKTLFELSIGVTSNLVVLSPKSLIEKFPPITSLQKYAQWLSVGQKINRDEFLQALNLMGYSKVAEVLDKGTFSLKGSLFEVFPIDQDYPVRIDLFGDEIELLKTFDPSSKRSLKDLKELIVGPARLIILDDTAKALAEEKLLSLADDIDFPTLKLKEKINEIKNDLYFFGIEKFLPAFFSNTYIYLDLLKNKPKIIFHDKEKIISSLKVFYEELKENYKKSILNQELIFKPEDYFLPINNFIELLDKFDVIDISNTKNNYDTEYKSKRTNDLREAILQETISTHKEDSPHLLKPLINRIIKLHKEGQAVIIAVSSREHEQQLKNLLKDSKLNLISLREDILWNKNHELFKNNIHAYIYIVKNLPSSGAEFTFLNLTIISEEDIFGKRKRKDEAKKSKGFSTSLADLDVGDLVVHIDHGLGRFHGLKRLNLHGVASDYILIVYASEEKLYLPAHRINLIKPYGLKSEGQVRLDKLGGTLWMSKKSKVKEAVLAMAQDLLKLYAQREMVKRPSFIEPDHHFLEFEAGFPFEATIDQQKAIDDVISDMQKDKPMDRLVCGDVGYGKTEVCMRASMLSVLSGRQVAILAPTTVLAQQHGLTFKERFKNTGVNIGVISRFQSSKEIKQILQKIKEQKIDIVIGTHRLLSPDIHFANLGLIVIDEEQRFGIKAKEHLKKMRTRVDALTMSATPIPRTLQMSYLGIRDLSIIETPPVDRKAIQTFIAQFEDDAIKEAILREINRQGQVYFVHNRVNNIQAMADYLQSLVPFAKIGIAHGQMPENELEERMIDFIEHRIDILVCTTIIETGIDVPKANTMFINDADDFGLSQLYQLRGRIGRSKERAFAYLLIKSAEENLTAIAKARLEILHRFSELGAGFRIAQHDLELRGAGDLLGKNQHGHMAAVGFDLYADLLKDAILELKGETHEDEIEPEVTLPISALIPEDYCPDLHERMSFYQKLACVNDEDAVNNIMYSMEDLLGDLPEEVINLKNITILKLELKKAKIIKLEIGKISDGFVIGINFSSKANLDNDKLTKLLESNKDIKITPQQKLVINSNKTDLFEACLDGLKRII